MTGMRWSHTTTCTSCSASSSKPSAGRPRRQDVVAVLAQQAAAAPQDVGVVVDQQQRLGRSLRPARSEDRKALFFAASIAPARTRAAAG